MSLAKLTALLISTFFLLASSSHAAVVWAVGDGANGSNTNDTAVANLIAADNFDSFLYLGDVYESGTADEFSDNYDPTYGLFKAKSYPTPGNHEWGNRATGYFPYWASQIVGQNYYSFDIGGWHLISLNSEHDYGPGGAQAQWLHDDLASHPGTCNIAYFHRPRYSAGSHGDNSDVDVLWQQLVGHVAVVFNGHDHNYQRISKDSITEFVVGTGGRSNYALDTSYSGLQSYDATNFGALRMVLSSDQLSYAFKTVSNTTPDSGIVSCQRPGSSGSSSSPAGSSPSGTSSEPTLSDSTTSVADAVGPGVLLSIVGKGRSLNTVIRKGLPLAVSCDEECTLTLKLNQSYRDSKGRRRNRELGALSTALTANQRKTVRLKIKATYRRLLRSHKKNRLTLKSTAKDRAGNVAVLEKIIHLYS